MNLVNLNKYLLFLLTGVYTHAILAEMKRSQSKILGLRIPTELWAALEQKAAQEHRDVSKQARHILSDFFCPKGVYTSKRNSK